MGGTCATHMCTGFDDRFKGQRTLSHKMKAFMVGTRTATISILKRVGHRSLLASPCAQQALRFQQLRRRLGSRVDLPPKLAAILNLRRSSTVPAERNVKIAAVVRPANAHTCWSPRS